VHNGNCQPTRMMYSTELPWPVFNQVMKTLISQKFLAEVEDQVDKRSRARYRITEEGERFLEYLGKALDSVDLIEEVQFINSY
jgi:predicted transcriptional regulator